MSRMTGLTKEEARIRNMRRRRARRRRRMINGGINVYRLLWLIIIVMFVAIAFMIGLIIRNSVEQSEFLAKQVQYYDEQLTKYSDQIKELQSEEADLLDELYYSVKEQCMNSDDEVVRMLWNSEFENDEVFTANRNHGVTVIYGILNNHPDLRYEVTVAQALYDMECARANIENKVDFYNSLFDNYTNWVHEYNDSIICRLRGGEIKGGKHLKMILGN